MVVPNANRQGAQPISLTKQECWPPSMSRCQNVEHIRPLAAELDLGGSGGLPRFVENGPDRLGFAGRERDVHRAAWEVRAVADGDPAVAVPTLRVARRHVAAERGPIQPMVLVSGPAAVPLVASVSLTQTVLFPVRP
jgi:hypothetical protein